MNPEKFNPSNQEYKKIEDLPNEERDKFVDVEGGFVKKEAFEQSNADQQKAEKINKGRPLLKKILDTGKVTGLDVAHGEALKEDWERTTKKIEERVKKEYEQTERFPSFSHSPSPEQLSEWARKWPDVTPEQRRWLKKKHKK